MKRIDMGSWLAQLKHAAWRQQLIHNDLIGAGFLWDGMDGYTAPPGSEAKFLEIVTKERSHD